MIYARFSVADAGTKKKRNRAIRRKCAPCVKYGRGFVVRDSATWRDWKSEIVCDGVLGVFTYLEPIGVEGVWLEQARKGRWVRADGGV